MALAQVVSDVPSGRLPSEIQQRNSAGDGGSSPDSETEASLKTPLGVPPYLHHRYMSSNSALFLVGSLVGLLWFITAKQDVLEVEV